MSLPRAKYVVIRHPDFAGLELPLMFSEALPHKAIAGAMRVVSAGFCSVDGHEAHAWGRSEGLGVESRGETDARLLRVAFCRRLPAFQSPLDSPHGMAAARSA